MDKKHYLEAGKIINTHGIHGEIKIEPWTDDPYFLLNLDKIFIDGNVIKITSSRVHKSFLLMSLDGVGNFNDAIKLKNKIVYISRDDAKLEPGQFFIADLIGLRAVDEITNNDIGIISDYLSRPANDVYVITDDRQNEVLIPAVPQFVKEINQEAGYIKFHLLEGM